MKLLEGLRQGSKDHELATGLDPKRIPSHIAIIMDGNGRWAKRRGLPRVAGHTAGVSVVRNTVQDCSDLGVKALTLYAFSAENWKRPRTEIEVLWRLLRFYLRQYLTDLMKNNVRLQSIGHVEALPKRALEELRATETATARNTGMTLTLAINYSARVDLVDAVNSLIDDARIEGQLAHLSVTEDMITRRLSTTGLPEPDLLIRTSGEMRVSNFLLWQIAYSEIYVTNTLWPDFNRTELLMAVQEFQRRDRRFGGLSEPVQIDTEIPASMELPGPELEEIAVSSK